MFLGLTRLQIRQTKQEPDIFAGFFMIILHKDEHVFLFIIKKKHFKEMNSYVGTTMVKKNRDKMIISIKDLCWLVM